MTSLLKLLFFFNFLPITYIYNHKLAKKHCILLLAYPPYIFVLKFLCWWSQGRFFWYCYLYFIAIEIIACRIPLFHARMSMHLCIYRSIYMVTDALHTHKHRCTSGLAISYKSLLFTCKINFLTTNGNSYIRKKEHAVCRFMNTKSIHNWLFTWIYWIF